ncbi:bacterial transferase hexapeptide repeat protein [Segatella oris F0302]|uniref:Serine acetyltransferase n=1 Tax=Segatella oris F0302 TaxID=649760 RepID=D1QQA1_9BACT|nr:serine acetyltransferase [Segatella oris]EFB32307.1 bacterial transferase hexapeptide repeat protein [Segatella oris F0302]
MTYKECLDYIRSDYYRIRGNANESILKMWFITFLDGGFRFLFYFRLSNCNNYLLSRMSRLLCLYIGSCLRISIQRNTKIGYGFHIAHGGPVVVNASAIIGDNVDIYQYTTIGSSFFHAAKVGNNVYIGPSVCIVEDIRIGDGATIGAGAVVVNDIKEGTTVAGNPARVVSNKEPGRLIWRRWKREWNEYKKE